MLNGKESSYQKGLKLVVSDYLETYPPEIILSEAFLRDHPIINIKPAQLIIRLYQDLEKIMAPEEIIELLRTRRIKDIIRIRRALALLEMRRESQFSNTPKSPSPFCSQRHYQFFEAIVSILNLDYYEIARPVCFISEELLIELKIKFAGDDFIQSRTSRNIIEFLQMIFEMKRKKIRRNGKLYWEYTIIRYLTEISRL